MATLSSGSAQAPPARGGVQSGVPASSGFREDARIIAFMAIGLLVSFAYIYSAAFGVFSRAQLPRPLFTSLAVILSVLLLTPARRWWLYLAVYYVLQVGLAAWFTTISLPLLAASNIANVFEPLIVAVRRSRRTGGPCTRAAPRGVSPRSSRCHDSWVHAGHGDTTAHQHDLRATSDDRARTARTWRTSGRTGR
jgi:hypothetical protein